MEPGSALLSEPARYQLAHRVVCRSTLPLGDLDASPVRLVRWVLALDDALAEHAVEPDDLVAADDALLAGLDALPALQAIGTTMRATAVRRRLLAHLVTALREEKRARDVVDFADQVRLAARRRGVLPRRGVDCCGPGTRSCCSTSTRTRRSRSDGCSRRCSGEGTR